MVDTSFTKPVPVVHLGHHPVGAKGFLEPVIQHLNARGLPTELWLEVIPGTERFAQSIRVPWREVPCQLTRSPRNALATFRRLNTLIRTLRPRILHCHQTRASLWPLLAGRMNRVPVRVYHNHGLSYPAFEGASRTGLRWLQRTLVGLSTHAWFVSESTLQLARRDGVVGNGRGAVPGPGSIAGIDLEEFPAALFSGEARRIARERHGLVPEAMVFGFVGRPMVSKGFHQLLDGWVRSGVASGGARLLCAGCSAEDVAARGIQASNGVIGLGYIQDMKTFYAACDGVVLPSRSEGFPYSLLEASAAGRATIGTSVPGILDAVEPGRTGYLIPKDDAGALAEVLRRLCADPAHCAELGEAGRRMVETRFSRAGVLDALWAHYVRDLLPAAGCVPDPGYG